jgi:hypothetical protein
MGLTTRNTAGTAGQLERGGASYKYTHNNCMDANTTAKPKQFCNMEGHLHECGLLVQGADLVHNKAVRDEGREGKRGEGWEKQRT